MPSEFDFDPRNSDLNIGIEVEYPVMRGGDEYLVNRGHGSNDLQHEMPGRMPTRIGGRATYDGTVGLEVVSDVLDLADAPMWYADVLEYVENEYNGKYQPTGIMSSGSTAGTHVHLSSLSSNKAQDLFEISQEPWAHIFFCSSVAKHDNGITWPVHRGGNYCQMQMGHGHYDVVNLRDERRGHYEWRLPEPMVPEHLEVFVKFLRIFEQDTQEAVQYAQELLDEGDERITAIRRAEKIGMSFDEMPVVERDEAPNDPEGFYSLIESEWYYPEITRVELDGDYFYVMESSLDTIDTPFGEYDANNVLWADSLEETSGELREEVRAAYQRASSDTQRETEATKELKKIVKKKKA